MSIKQIKSVNQAKQTQQSVGDVLVKVALSLLLGTQHTIEKFCIIFLLVISGFSLQKLLTFDVKNIALA